MTTAPWTIPTAHAEHPDDPTVGRDPPATNTDPHAFADLYRHHFPAIAGYLYRRTGNRELAEDLAADTFLAAWNALPSYRDTGVPFRYWLLRIATNRANHAARRERVRRRVYAFLPVRQTERGADAAGDALLSALARVSPEHQAVIALVHLEDMGVEHAARVLGLAPGTVKSRLHRARNALRAELERQGINR